MQRLQAIEEEIQDDLLQLNTVAAHRRQRARQIQHQPRLVRPKLGPQERRHLLEQFLHVEYLEHGFARLQERPHPLDDRGGALLVPLDVTENRVHFVEVRRHFLEEKLARFRVAKNRSERLADLVRKSG